MSVDENVAIPVGEVRSVSKDTFRKQFETKSFGFGEADVEACQLDYTPCINRTVHLPPFCTCPGDYVRC